MRADACECGQPAEVLDSRRVNGYVRRRRQCKKCGIKWTTIELRQDQLPKEQPQAPPPDLTLREVSDQVERIRLNVKRNNENMKAYREGLLASMTRLEKHVAQVSLSLAALTRSKHSVR